MVAAWAVSAVATSTGASPGPCVGSPGTGAASGIGAASLFDARTRDGDGWWGATPWPSPHAASAREATAIIGLALRATRPMSEPVPSAKRTRSLASVRNCTHSSGRLRSRNARASASVMAERSRTVWPHPRHRSTSGSDVGTPYSGVKSHGLNSSSFLIRYTLLPRILGATVVGPRDSRLREWCPERSTPRRKSTLDEAPGAAAHARTTEVSAAVSWP